AEIDRERDQHGADDDRGKDVSYHRGFRFEKWRGRSTSCGAIGGPSPPSARDRRPSRCEYLSSPPPGPHRFAFALDGNLEAPAAEIQLPMLFDEAQIGVEPQPVQDASAEARIDLFNVEVEPALFGELFHAHAGAFVLATRSPAASRRASISA